MKDMSRTVPGETSREPLGILLRRFFYAMRVMAEEVMPATGFTMPQFGVMMGLKRHPGQSAADLARRAFVTPQAMGEMLIGLEKSGYIRRSRAEGRKVDIKLTRQGEDALERCNQALKSVEARMFAPLSEKEKDKLADLLALCLVNFSQDPAAEK